MRQNRASILMILILLEWFHFRVQVYYYWLKSLALNFFLELSFEFVYV